MNPEVQAAMIAAVGAVSGAVVTVLGPIIARRLRGRTPDNRDLRGEWLCEWKVDASSSLPPVIVDTVQLSHMSGERYKGRGINPSRGNYVLEGRASLSGLLTFYYEGEREKRALGGVVVLELAPTRDRMQGRWAGYTETREFIGGAVSWKRRAVVA